jgi:hypothetical protein
MRVNPDRCSIQQVSNCRAMQLLLHRYIHQLHHSCFTAGFAQVRATYQPVTGYT